MSADDSMATRVLVVEDDEVCRELLNHLLGARGVEVLSAANGKEAVDIGLTQSCDFVLMDLQMPVMDGWQATRALRDGGFTKPIIAVTGASELEGAQLSKMGFDGYFPKPIDYRRLLTYLTDEFGLDSAE